MPEHESKYFAMPLEEMLEQSAPRMLAWATRWKMGIYQSVRQAKDDSTDMEDLEARTDRRSQKESR